MEFKFTKSSSITYIFALSFSNNFSLEMIGISLVKTEIIEEDLFLSDKNIIPINPTTNKNIKI
jgi:hypothetical protein